MSLVVLELEAMKLSPVASFKDADIGTLSWVNNERLVFKLANFNLQRREDWVRPGTYAVNRDGGALRRLPDANILLSDVGHQDSDEIFVASIEGHGKSVNDFWRLNKLNTATGREQEIEVPTYSNTWLFDQAGQLRVAVKTEGSRHTLIYKDVGSTQWNKLNEFDLLSSNIVEPIAIGPDNTLYVRSNLGKDKTAIYRYDLNNHSVLPDPLIYSNDYDIGSGLLFDQKKLLGVRYEIDAEVTQWFDLSMRATQKMVDELLPATTNRISFGARSETPFFIVDAFSDRQPHVFFLYNSATHKLSKLGAAHPDIDPKQMSPMDMVHYQARDGMTIPAYITMPIGQATKNLPMVVLIHGGPWVRGGHWEWNPEVQFLASRGYVVLQPEFRGSTGFGSRHFKAGWKQWGLAMQDDITDGTNWAIAQGIADPKRICIAGASYGGYATLMGLIKNPDMYRCGIEWVGVTDINLMYSVRWSDFSDVAKNFSMPIMIGDRTKDAEQLNATSPLRLATQIRQPLLMAYGSADERVPIIHGEEFYEAIKKVNKDVEWIEYPDEGHGWYFQNDRFDFWTKVERFLDRNVGLH